ncbi:hypothetical protein HRbin28_00465 [bacterium HR28]|nr:hypothetical protein HRbin28_00465 [bacterium HR28]
MTGLEKIITPLVLLKALPHEARAPEGSTVLYFDRV